MLFFCSFFKVTEALGMLLKTDLAAKGILFDASIEGYTWLCAFLVLVALTPCYLKANKVFFWLVIVADVAVLFIALADLGIAKASLALAAGWLLLLAGFLALYLVAAIAINGVF